jgi:hypothetical protein
VRRSVTVGLVGALLAGGSGLLSGAAQAAGDRPDTYSAAKSAAASTNSTWLRERLGSADDKDWYRFTTSKDRRVLVTLGHLPADYQLRVYNASGHLAASSDRAGRKFEQVYVSLSAGDNFVRVTASGDTVNPDRNYWVKFRPLANAVVVAEQKGSIDAQGFEARGELLNNTNTRVTIQRLRVVFFNKDGDKVGTTDEGIRPGSVGKHRRVEFEIERDAVKVPAGARTYRIRATAEATDEPVQRGIKMDPAPVQSATSNQRVYSGVLTNTTDHTITDIYPTVIEYDSLGRANAIGYGLVKTLAAGAEKKYSLAIGGADVPVPNATRQYPTIVNGLA